MSHLLYVHQYNTQSLGKWHQIIICPHNLIKYPTMTWKPAFYLWLMDRQSSIAKFLTALTLRNSIFQSAVGICWPHNTCVHVCLRAQVSMSHNTNGSVSVFTKYGFDHRQNDTWKMSPPKCHFGSMSARVVEWVHMHIINSLIKQPVSTWCHPSALTAKSFHLFCHFEWN